MKKNLHNSLLYVILYGIFFYFINLVLSNNNIQFMNWIYYLTYSIIILGFIIGIFQFISKIKNKTKRKIFLVVMVIFISILICVLTFIFMIAYTPDYIIIKDGNEMVANVQSFHHTYIEYYEYLNPFMKSKSNIDSEYYSNGSYDPFKTDINYMNLLK